MERILLNSEEKQKFEEGKIEILDLYNKKVEFVFCASRKVAHQLNFYCITCQLYVEMFNGKIVWQKRSKILENTPKEGIKRECLEELGFEPKKIEFLGKTRIDDSKHNQFVYFFKTKYDGVFNIDKKEIEELQFLTKQEIKEFSEEKFTPAGNKQGNILFRF